MNVTLTLTEDQLEELADRVARKMGKVTGNPLTVAEFAKAIKRDESYVRRLIYAGTILKSKAPGQTIIPASELDRYRRM